MTATDTIIDRLTAAAPLHALLTPTAEVRSALTAQAAAAPVGGALAGMPVVVKDNICTLEYTTTCGSRILEGYRSPFEATAVTRLKAAGALIAGKTNCDEFAMGSSTEHSAYGRSFHPIDRERVPGGSSGGSAALVGAGTVPAALGSETGGSVRQPAAFCGVVGIKPTYGRVSRYGLVAFGSSLDQIGVFGRTVSDAGRVLAAISGRDPLDATCEDRDPLPLPAVPENLQGFVIGIPKEYFPPDLDPGVRRACDRTIKLLKDLGAAVREVSLPHTSYAIPTYYIIAPAEASSNLARYDGVRYGPRPVGAVDVRALYRATRGHGFGAEVRRRDAHRYVRAVGRLLRRVLPPGAADAGAHRPGFPQRLRSRRGSAVHALDAVAAVQGGREARRPRRHVSGRHLHGHGESRRVARADAADRPGRRVAGRRAAHRAGLPRG